jgi:Cytochrome c7 and related cytochrome c
MHRVILVGTLIIGTLSACIAFAQVNRGAETIRLRAGQQAPVIFPHRRHQNVLDDCLVCHSLFPQEKGSIDKEKAEGKLARQQVMTTLCIRCHRARLQAGEQSGPLTCEKCHKG